MKRTYLKWIVGILAVLVVMTVIVARLYMGVWLLAYVNKSLNKTDDYSGSVQSIDIDLYRGAYQIHHLKINKKDAGIPTPFISIENVDLSIQWAALLHGRVVSSVDLLKPEIHFAVNKEEAQTGAGEDWTKTIKDLAPVDINHVTFENGSIFYQDFSSTPKVDIYIHHMGGEVTNLRNVVDKAQPLPSRLVIHGDSIGGGLLDCRGRLNILKQVPDMDVETKLENTALPALNSYSNAYAALDFKAGTISIYSQVTVKDNEVSGYIKPIVRNISLVDLRKDSNPLKVVWEAIASSIITIFSNHHVDQFATKVQLEGNLQHIQTDIWSTIGGILHNAFVSAMQKGFDPSVKGNAAPAASAPASTASKVTP